MRKSLKILSLNRGTEQLLLVHIQVIQSMIPKEVKISKKLFCKKRVIKELERNCCIFKESL
jgi:hypothetical protein